MPFSHRLGVVDMRYDRQIIIEGFGQDGQAKLSRAKVLVVGVGGLGCPALTYLVQAGIGKLGFIDSDVVSESNLNRQFLHFEKDLGRKKVDSAFEKLIEINSKVELVPFDIHLNKDNARELIKGYDLVLACLDNIETRMLLNKICLEEDIPVVNGGIDGFYGFAFVASRKGACLECMGYQNTKMKHPFPALGAVAGVIGSLQANMAIGMLLGNNSYQNKLFQFDARLMTLDEIDISISEDCSLHNRWKDEK